MSSAIEPSVELSLKLRLTTGAQRKLEARAAAQGKDFGDYAASVLEESVRAPTVDEVLAPFRRQVADSGMSDQELDSFFEDLRDEVWSEEHGTSRP